MAYVAVALVAIVVLIALVLVGAHHLGSSSVQIRGSLIRLFTFEITLDRSDAPRPQLPAPPVGDVPSTGTAPATERVADA